ncbi:MAG: class I SAM-dependent methyltransferase, partial [Nocardioidaceae bacterium]
DLGCGDGRHAAWLASHGWQVEAVDFSATAIDQAGRRPDADQARIAWTVADALTWQPTGPVDLVLVAYLHLVDLGTVLAGALAWLGPSGTLVYLGHALENIEHGVGGPQEPVVLPTVEQLAAAVGGARVHRLEHVPRETADGTAVDVLAVVSPWA